jgi:hypothetical protein
VSALSTILQAPFRRTGSLATALKGEIYVIGGYRPEDSYWVGYTDARTFNPTTGVWTEKRALNDGRCFAATRTIRPKGLNAGEP